MTFTPHSLDGQAGAQRLLAMNPYRKPGLCLEAVSKALGSYTLVSIRPGYFTYALRVWEQTPANRRHTDRNVPAGAIVYLSAGANGYGHICVSLGGDRVVSTDTPSGTGIGITTITALCAKWGRAFVGWSDWMMGHNIVNLGPVAATVPATAASAGTVWVQERLKVWNVDPGPVDGLFGPKTKAGVIAFQAGHGLKKDGIVGPLTHAALALDPAPASGGLLKKGSKGPAVKALQTMLNRKYPLYSKLKEDGDFGPATDKVVREFQRRAKLKVDGVVGPKTRAAIGGL